MRNTAKEYHNYGLATLPTKPDKSPNVKGTWKDGITDLSQYDNAFGIGIICGNLSGNLECYDFDNHHGDAKETLSKFITEIQDLYDKYKFPIESTMTGGFHLLLRCEHVDGNLKLASKPLLDKKTNKWRPDAIIETRGEGGYFVAAPTKGYKIIRNNILDIPEITKEERSIIISVAKSFNEWSDVRKDSYELRDKPGDLFNNDIESKDEMINVLKNDGWTELKGGIWRRPGKKDGISATIGKVADNVFYNFSSNAFPFEPGSGYTPFQVIGLLKYNSDFKKFAQELAERYEMNKPVKKEYAKTKTKPKEKNELEDILNKSYIDLNIPVVRPPVALKIRDFGNGQINEKRLFTLGNFSAITGKSKSKKTFLTSILLAAAVKKDLIYRKIVGCLPENKQAVLLFDTEQSNYDAYKTSKRVIDIIGYDCDNFGSFDLREFTPLERCEIIEYALEKFKDNLGYVVIDGIADLANAINDEIEAVRVVSLLMKWTKIYNCHITTVIHQNKNDSYATGHIGSAILKKAEAIISVTKDDTDNYRSKVECDMIRGTSDFEPFNIEIKDNGIPIITDMDTISKEYEIRQCDF